MTEHEFNESRERVLDAAEALFIAGGFAAVKLRHIAERLGIKESSIYYHFPDGKKQLFVAVMHRTANRHRQGIAEALAGAGDDWVTQLRAVCQWLASQPALDVMRMSRADLPALDRTAAFEIEEAIYEAVQLPIRAVLERGVAAGEAEVADAELIAGTVVAMVASLDTIRPEWNPKSRAEMVDVLVDSWVHGLRRR